MATERLLIQIDEKGARVVKRNIEDIGQTSRGAEGSVQLLRRALGLVGGALVIRQLAQVADSFTRLQNRLRVVTSGQRELNTVTRELVALSNNTRSSLEGNADLFSRLSLSTRELGLSQREVLEITESLNQATLVSGASAIEAEQGLRQLAQGLASNRLSGDELRSVLEQLPVVADVIGKQLGVTRGELKAFGEQGRITADVVIKAFQAAREELAEKFAKTIPTLDQAFTVLNTNFTLFVGELDKATGITAFFSKTIIAASENLETFGKIAGVVAIVLATFLIPKGILAAVAALKLLGVALLANPFTALLVGITTAVAALVVFSDKLFLTKDNTTTLRDFFVAAFEAIGSAINSVLGRVNAVFASLFGETNKVFDTINGNLGLFIRNIARALDKVVNNFQIGLLTIETAWENLPFILGELGARSINNFLSFIETGINKAIDLLNLFSPVTGLELTQAELTRVENDFGDGGKRFGEALFKGLQERSNFSFFSDQVDNLLERADELAQSRLDAQQTPADLTGRGAAVDVNAQKANREIDEILRKLEREGELLGLNNREREIQNELFKIEEQLRKKNLELGERAVEVEAALRANQAIRERRQLLDEIKGSEEDAINRLQRLNELRQDESISLEEFTRKQRELRLIQLENVDTFEAGAERAFLKFQDTVDTTAQATEKAFTGAFEAANTAVEKFVRTGKISLRSLFQDLSSQLLKSGSRQLTSSLLGSASSGLSSILAGGAGGGTGGAGGGGLASFFSGLTGGQNGLDFNVNSASSSSLGSSAGVDNRLVAFRAKEGERVKVSPKGESSSGRPINVNFNVSTPDANSFKRSQGQILARTSAALSRANQKDN